MKQGDQQLDHSRKPLWKSCNTIMQNDLTASFQNQQELLRKSAPQKLAVGTRRPENILTTSRRPQLVQENKKTMQEFQLYLDHGEDFNVEAAESFQQEVECFSFSSEQLQKARGQNRSKEKQKQKTEQIPKIFTVFLTGRTNVGKKSFAKIFAGTVNKEEKFQFSAGSTTISKRKLELKNIKLVFLETQGYTDDTISEYTKAIHEYALERQNNPGDQYNYPVNCCLFLIDPSQDIKQNDLKVLKLLSKSFKLLPIISKADILPIDDILEVKKRWKNLLAEEGQVEIPNINDIILSLRGDNLQNIVGPSPYGEELPYVIFCAYDGRPVRKYPWGNMEPFNHKHTDLHRVKVLLEELLPTYLINSTLKVKEWKDPGFKESVKRRFQYQKYLAIFFGLTQALATGFHLLSKSK